MSQRLMTQVDEDRCFLLSDFWQISKRCSSLLRLMLRGLMSHWRDQESQKGHPFPEGLWRRGMVYESRWLRCFPPCPRNYRHHHSHPSAGFDIFLPVPDRHQMPWRYRLHWPYSFLPSPRPSVSVSLPWPFHLAGASPRESFLLALYAVGSCLQSPFHEQQCQ